MKRIAIILAFLGFILYLNAFTNEYILSFSDYKVKTDSSSWTAWQEHHGRILCVYEGSQIVKLIFEDYGPLADNPNPKIDTFSVRFNRNTRIDDDGRIYNYYSCEDKFTVMQKTFPNGSEHFYFEYPDTVKCYQAKEKKHKINPY